MADMVKVIGEVMKATREPSRTREGVGLSEILDVLKVARQDNSGNAMTMKDVLTLLPTLKEVIAPNKIGTDDFTKTMQNFMLLQKMLGQMGSMQPEEGEGNFWDFASNLVQQFPKLSEAINAAKTKDAAPGAANGKPVEKGDPIPSAFKLYAKKMESAFEAEDDGQLLEQTLRGLMVLRKHDPKWSKHINSFFALCKRNDKENALKYVEVFLRQFVKHKLIQTEVAEAAYACFDEYWETILEKFGFKEPEQTPEPESVPNAPAAAESNGNGAPDQVSGPGEGSTEETEDDWGLEDEDEESEVEAPAQPAAG
jgi:hypothetical protein